MSEFKSPAAEAAFSKSLARYEKTLDAKQLAALKAIAKEGRDLVGWREFGRMLLAS